jgi:hypothetical protein
VQAAVAVRGSWSPYAGDEVAQSGAQRLERAGAVTVVRAFADAQAPPDLGWRHASYIGEQDNLTLALGHEGNRLE